MKAQPEEVNYFWKHIQLPNPLTLEGHLGLRLLALGGQKVSWIGGKFPIFRVLPHNRILSTSIQLHRHCFNPVHNVLKKVKWDFFPLPFVILIQFWCNKVILFKLQRPRYQLSLGTSFNPTVRPYINFQSNSYYPVNPIPTPQQIPLEKVGNPNLITDQVEEEGACLGPWIFFSRKSSTCWSLLLPTGYFSHGTSSNSA